MSARVFPQRLRREALLLLFENQCVTIKKVGAACRFNDTLNPHYISTFIEVIQL